MPCKSKQAIFDLANIDSAKQYVKSLLLGITGLKGTPLLSGNKVYIAEKANVVCGIKIYQSYSRFQCYK